MRLSISRSASPGKLGSFVIYLGHSNDSPASAVAQRFNHSSLSKVKNKNEKLQTGSKRALIGIVASGVGLSITDI